MNNLKTRGLVKGESTLILNDNYNGYIEGNETSVYTIKKLPLCYMRNLNGCHWHIKYYPANNATSVDYDDNNNPVNISIVFNKAFDGRITLEAKGLPTETYPFLDTKHVSCYYSSHKDVFVAISNRLTIKVTVEVYAIIDFVQESRTDFIEYYGVCPDFEIHCDNKQYYVHKAVLSKISPVFKAMLEYDCVETSSSKLAIDDFDFKTIETALNIVYGRPSCELSIELVINILYFAEKYFITDIFEQYERAVVYNLTLTNFCAVIRCAADIEKPKLFAECAKYFKSNEDSIKTTAEFTTLPETLVIKLYKVGYQFETELDTFLYLRQTGNNVDIKHMKITTLADFVKTAKYAWKHSEEDLKIACAKYFQENKDLITETSEYQSLIKTIQYSLNVLGSSFKTGN